MKYTKIPTETLYAKDIDRTDKLVYMALHTFCYGKKNTCFPSTEVVGKMLGLTRRSISTSITNLVKQGYIERTIRHGQSNIYKMVK